MIIEKYDVVLQEVPGEISLVLYCKGCPLKCSGCHSPELWSFKKGTTLTIEDFDIIIKKYQNYITNVLFMGGEWFPEFLDYINHIKINYKHLKISLYTGLDISEVSTDIIENLNYIKYGRYIDHLGGINNIQTNQRMINLDLNVDISHKFQK